MSDVSLDDLELAVVEKPPILQKSSETKAKPPEGFRYWYDSICDALFEHPGWNLTDVAKHLNRSTSWVYVVAKSDSFRKHYEDRRNELNDRISLGITKKASELAMRSLDAVLEKMVDNPASFTTGMHMEIIGATSKVLGMGTPRGPAVVVQQQTTIVPAASQSELARARELITNAERARLAQPLPVVADGGRPTPMGIEDATVIDADPLDE